MGNIVETNRLLIRLIGQSQSPTILGLLPVELSVQEACIGELRDYLGRDFGRLQKVFGFFPAAAVYAIAVSVGRGVTDANFYDPIREQLGLTLNSQERAGMAACFANACRKLGMAMPPDTEEGNTDRNLRQIIFQAGILPYWVRHLGPAVTSYLERNVCPDLEDEEQVRRFAEVISQKVPDGQRRLQRTLLSNVGPLVAKSILLAFSSGDFDLLPPHLREPMREARRRSGAESIRSPFLRCRRETGELVLVLPRQNAKIADYRTFWSIDQRTYNALIERELDVADLPGTGIIHIKLEDLRQPYQNQKFSVKVAPDEREPFFLFRALDGRRLLTGEHTEIELPLGDYELLLGEGLVTNDDSAYRAAGRFRVAHIEIFPGRETLEISTGDRNYTIRPRLGADILIQDPSGNRLATLEGASIFFGETLNVLAFSPAVEGADEQSLNFRIELLVSSHAPPITAAAVLPVQRDAYLFYELTDNLLRPFVASLPAGVFELQISAEGRSRSFHRKFIYWKGFYSTSSVFGFLCASPVQNLDLASSPGLVQSPEGLRLLPNHAGSAVTLSMRQPKQVFTLAKPGIWLGCQSAEHIERLPLSIGASVEISPASRETIFIESGDLLPWQISCRSIQLAILKPGHPRCALNASVLLAQFGEQVNLLAENPAGTRVQLVRLVKANLFRDLKVECPPGTLVYQASFRVSKSQVKVLEISRQNFAADSIETVKTELELVCGRIPESGLGETAAFWNIEDGGDDWVIRLEAKLDEILPGVHFIDFRGQTQDQDVWQSMKVADVHGLSENRLVVISAKPALPISSWSQLIASASGSFQRGSNFDISWLEIDAGDMMTILERLQQALLFKYASAVWPQVRWLELTLTIVCQRCFNPKSEGRLLQAFVANAVAGLERRSSAGLSINSILVMGCQSKLLSVNGGEFASVSRQNGMVARYFSELGSVAQAATLRDYAWSGCELAEDFLTHFDNFNVVARNAESEFSRFKFAEYFKHLGDAIQELDFQQSRLADDRLLSASHFLSAIRSLNRRFRPLEEVRQQNIPTGSLNRMVGDLQAMSRQIDSVGQSLKEKLNIPAFVELKVPLAMAECELVQSVSDILLLIAGMARLKAAGLISRDVYKGWLRSLLVSGDSDTERRIRRFCLLLSLSPELFAFYMLFWESALKPQARHE